MMHEFNKNFPLEIQCQSFCSVIIETTKLKTDDIPNIVLACEFSNLGEIWPSS